MPKKNTLDKSKFDFIQNIMLVVFGGLIIVIIGFIVYFYQDIGERDNTITRMIYQVSQEKYDKIDSRIKEVEFKQAQFGHVINELELKIQQLEKKINELMLINKHSTRNSINEEGVTKTSKKQSDVKRSVESALDLAVTAYRMLAKNKATIILDDIQSRELKNISDSENLNKIVDEINIQINNLKKSEMENESKMKQMKYENDRILYTTISTLRSASILTAQAFEEILKKIEREKKYNRSDKEILMVVKNELVRLKNLPKKDK